MIFTSQNYLDLKKKSHLFPLWSPSWDLQRTSGNKGRSALFLHRQAPQWRSDRTSYLQPSTFAFPAGPATRSPTARDWPLCTDQPEGKQEYLIKKWKIFDGIIVVKSSHEKRQKYRSKSAKHLQIWIDTTIHVNLFLYFCFPPGLHLAWINSQVKSVWPLTFKRTPNWADETKHSLLRGRSPAPGCPAGCAHSPHSPQSASHRCSCWCRSIRMFRLPRWRYRPPSEGICKHVEHAENSGATERWKWLNIIQY